MNEQYWSDKLSAYLHDPIDKAFRIQGHEARAKNIAEAIGVTTPDKTELGKADIAASGVDRAALPGFSGNPSEDGSVDFLQGAFLTHPITETVALPIDLPNIEVDQLNKDIVAVINEDTADKKNHWSRKQYFHYAFFALRKKLIHKNIGKLGQLWAHLPADTRIPDHNIWNHNAMVSALYSCYKESGGQSPKIGVFSITPVQSFIAKSRKLADYHNASVILSWLCAEGLLAVINELGPDHILYPSLLDQSMIEATVFKGLNLQDILENYQNTLPYKPDQTVASLPNKFVFLLPANQEKRVFEIIEEKINSKWQQLSGEVLALLKHKTGGDHLDVIFNRQIRNFWDFQWAACNFLTINDLPSFSNLFGDDKLKNETEIIKAFIAQFKDANLLYPHTHSLVQTLLAASKTNQSKIRQPEPGVKCLECGEFEVVHNMSDASELGSKMFKDKLTKFYGSIKFNNPYLLREKDRLCSICMIKRLAYEALKSSSNKELDLLADALGTDYPSTTEMATKELVDEINAKNPNFFNHEKKKAFFEKLHDADHDEEFDNKLKKELNKLDIKFKEQDKYFAVLAMDGDKIGDLVNGVTVSANWGSVLNPVLNTRIQSGILTKAVIKQHIHKKRILSPALHQSISDALGQFSIFGVSKIISNHDGKLIYAGGDDVLAILPLSKAFKAACEIQKLYNSGFVTQTSEGYVPAVKATAQNPTCRLLGDSAGVSISAALLIVHHKQPLQGVLDEVQMILKNEAKSKGGRNSIVVRVKKRSGQDRDFLCGWGEKSVLDNQQIRLNSFEEVIMACNDGYLSASLLYRLANLKIPVESLIKQKNAEAVRNQIHQMYSYEIEHSGVLKSKLKEKLPRKQYAEKFSKHLANIMIGKEISKNKNTNEFIAEAPVICNFLSKGPRQRRLGLRAACRRRARVRRAYAHRTPETRVPAGC